MLYFQATMTKVINGDLVLKKDTFLNENLIVIGDIIAKSHMKFSLFVEGSIEATNIKVKYMKGSKINANRIESEKVMAKFINANSLEIWDINSQSINCDEIDSKHVNCKDLSAHMINADFVVCEKFTPKNNNSKIMAKVFLENRFTHKRIEWEYAKEIVA